MSDVKELIGRLRARCAYGDSRLWRKHDPLANEAANMLANLHAALSGTREAVEPVGFTTKGQIDAVAKGALGGFWKFSDDAEECIGLYAAPPSDPVGHGAVTIAMIEPFDSVDPTESIGCFGGSGQWIEFCTVSELSALAKPAPEAGSDEVERLRKRVEPLVWVTSEVADLLQSQRGQDFQIRYRVLHGRPFDGAVPLYSETEITALREKLGEMREALEFYADKANWTAESQVNIHELFDTAMGDDLGERARATLANTDKEAGR